MHRQHLSRGTRLSSTSFLPMVLSFLLGCIVCMTVMLTTRVKMPLMLHDTRPGFTSSNQLELVAHVRSEGDSSVLDGLRILVAIAAYDFSQLPHLEEVLDSYHDLCVAGAKVDVVVHSTVAYPVTLIDMLNSRLTCTNSSPRAGFSVSIVLKSKRLRLHLVDEHRPLFYSKIDQYDLFIFTEDDIRVRPTTVATYLYETDRIKALVGPEKASDFNVGIARYEYNYPPDVIIDDKTRKVTQNVTRVYWEHVWKPAIPKSVDAVPQEPLSHDYVHMTNHHQGMFIATPGLLQAWRVRTGCQFDVVRDRPSLKNNPSQHSEGTQRVWMSSQMLYGNKHCNVQQVIPMDRFGALTVLHLPNKNYRRVGKPGRVGHDKSKKGTKLEPDGSETYEAPSDMLLSAMELHVEMRRLWPAKPQFPYNGIQMVDAIVGIDRTDLIERRLSQFEAYAARGGVMNQEDMKRVSLVE